MCEVGLANATAARDRPGALRLLRHARAVFVEDHDPDTVKDIDAMLQRLSR
jgi:hypothetical protein